MLDENPFKKLRRVSQIFKNYEINLAEEFYLVKKKDLSIMRDISIIFIDFIKKVYESQEYYNNDIELVNKMKYLTVPKLSFSPLRLDFLLNKDNEFIM
ncbi:MAG: hypothetical protein ACTSR8_12790 [Promethearchaeota archaeon]